MANDIKTHSRSLQVGFQQLEGAHAKDTPPQTWYKRVGAGKYNHSFRWIPHLAQVSKQNEYWRKKMWSWWIGNNMDQLPARSTESAEKRNPDEAQEERAVSYLWGATPGGDEHQNIKSIGTKEDMGGSIDFYKLGRGKSKSSREGTSFSEMRNQYFHDMLPGIRAKYPDLSLKALKELLEIININARGLKDSKPLKSLMNVDSPEELGLRIFPYLKGMGPHDIADAMVNAYSNEGKRRGLIDIPQNLEHGPSQIYSTIKNHVMRTVIQQDKIPRVGEGFEVSMQPIQDKLKGLLPRAILAAKTVQDINRITDAIVANPEAYIGAEAARRLKQGISTYTWGAPTPSAKDWGYAQWVIKSQGDGTITAKPHQLSGKQGNMLQRLLSEKYAKEEVDSIVRWITSYYEGGMVLNKGNTSMAVKMLGTAWISKTYAQSITTRASIITVDNMAKQLDNLAKQVATGIFNTMDVDANTGEFTQWVINQEKRGKMASAQVEKSAGKKWQEWVGEWVEFGEYTPRVQSSLSWTSFLHARPFIWLTASGVPQAEYVGVSTKAGQPSAGRGVHEDF